MLKDDADELIQREIAILFAAGFLRLRARAALPANCGQAADPEKLLETTEVSLAVAPKTALTVHTD